MFDGKLVEVIYNDDVSVTEHKVAEIFDLYDQVIGKQRVLKLLVIGKGTTITSEAREQILKQNIIRKEQVVAEAIVVTSKAQMLAANLYIKFIQLVYPTRHFTDREKAMEWLNDQYEKLEKPQSISSN
jgi:hypothetical protein